ncbi:MAG: IS30 family transposase [Patescibacteria group bacterium]
MSNEFTFFERQKLEYFLRTKQSLRAISLLMRRDHTLLSREIRRNGTSRKKYRADVAERLCEKRKHAKHRGKLDKHPALKQYVIAKLREDWSPEEIAGRLQELPPTGVDGTTISHESIYQYIYHKAEPHEHLYQHLRQGRPKRRRLRGRTVRQLRIPGRISIHARPEYIDERRRYGDWESDSMIFSKQKTCISVQAERKSRFVRIHKLKDKSAEETLNALMKTAESVPRDILKTMTFDNGTENVRHYDLTSIYDVDTYFCDPFASWQKGGVENMNKLIRQYLPRSIDLRQLAEEDIHAIEERLNNRPRKCLGYRTPNEVIQEVVL